MQPATYTQIKNCVARACVSEHWVHRCSAMQATYDTFGSSAAAAAAAEAAAAAAERPSAIPGAGELILDLRSGKVLGIVGPDGVGCMYKRGEGIEVLAAVGSSCQV